MITTKTYFPIIKTRDAELRGLCQLSQETKKGIIPLFELTKSRITQKNPDGPVAKRLEKIKDEFGKNLLAMDLVSFEFTYLQNKEILGYYDATNGFQKWAQFLFLLNRTIFPEIYPVLIVSDTGVNTEEDYTERHRSEIFSLSKFCEKIIYRVPGDYKGLEFDLQNFFAAPTYPIVLLDMGYIPKGKGKTYADAAKQSLKTIKQHGINEIVLAGSSYPSDPTENGEDESGENPLEEIVIYNACKAIYPNIVYGDYATIYPLDNHRAGGHGWIPRIDFPNVDSTSIIYHRSRKYETEPSYKPAYIRAAQKVVKDSRFRPLQKKLGETNWGIKQILLAAEGYPQGMSPSFWISVRINLHVTLRHLVLKNV